MLTGRFAVAVGLMLLGAMPGIADELRIASWNIANLASGPNLALRGYSRSAEDYALLANQARIFGTDIVALQEIGSIVGARAVLGDEYEIVFETRCTGNPRQCQEDNEDIYTAIAYRRALSGQITPFQIDELAIDHTSKCGETLPVRGGVGVRLDVDGQMTWIPSVHMKASCKNDRVEPGTEDDCRTQRKQYEALAEWIPARPEGDAVIVAGDMNRLLLDKDDSIRSEIFLSANSNTRFLPEGAQRGCWKAHSYDFRELSRQARQNNPVFDLQDITPHIYTPTSNVAIDFFVVVNPGSHMNFASDQIEMASLYRFENPGETLTACDGSVMTFGDRRALTFAEAYPSDHCPILLSIDY